ncbi:hypothetical protein JXB31_02380 [Candidatus Woesearchaeota archaeon]|nr:hypothetical protein [Candidatus Woesearchaeota archaeon]
MNKAVSLLSTGIDSPVASWLMKNQGVELTYLHLNTNPTDLKKVRQIKVKIDGNSSSELVIKDFMPDLKRIAENANRRLTCVLCKRAMYREAEALAKRIRAGYIVTGENLGQVASQTLENLSVLDNAVGIPVLRPLLCFDKKEAIDIARRIGTYDISVADTKGSACRFVPQNPATRANLEAVLREERKIFSVL